MKKIILAICISMISNSATADFDCNLLPDCDELGYHFDATQCVGRSSIKCPFDQTKMFCTPTTTMECSSDTIYDATTAQCVAPSDYCHNLLKEYDAGTQQCVDCSSSNIYNPSERQCVNGKTYCNQTMWQKFVSGQGCVACGEGGVIDQLGSNECMDGQRHCANWFNKEASHPGGIYVNGRCEVCPSDTFFDKERYTCQSVGQACGSDDRNKIYNYDGTCICKSNHVPKAEDTSVCVLVGDNCWLNNSDSDHKHYNSSGQCVCDTNYYEDKNKNCKYCPTGQIYDASAWECVNGKDYCYSNGQAFNGTNCYDCSDGNFVGDTGYCTKCNGYIKNATTCIAVGELCDDNEPRKVVTEDGKCACNADFGFISDGSGGCVCDAANKYMPNPDFGGDRCTYGPGFCPLYSKEYDEVTNYCKSCETGTIFDSASKKCIEVVEIPDGVLPDFGCDNIDTAYKCSICGGTWSVVTSKCTGV